MKSYQQPAPYFALPLLELNINIALLWFRLVFIISLVTFIRSK